MTDASARPFGSCIYSIPCLADLLSYRELFVYSLEDYASVAVFFCCMLSIIETIFWADETLHVEIKFSVTGMSARKDRDETGNVCAQRRSQTRLFGYLATMLQTSLFQWGCSVRLHLCFRQQDKVILG